MIHVIYEETSNNEAMVMQLNYVEPFDTSKPNSLVIEKEPELPAIPSGKTARLYYNKEQNTFSYKLFDRPPTQEEELENLKSKQELIQQALDELIFGGVV